MRIQHNISAMNSLTNYTANNKALAGNLEKLSSGYRINSAADDAAGLAISEKMRSQIKGLEKAQDNCNDGISLVQTAEGALTEVNSMLTRLTELATQSANGTYDNTTDRANIQAEVTQITAEIDRIAQNTNFNGIKLLDGSLTTGNNGPLKLQIGPTGKAGSNEGEVIELSIADMSSTGIAINGISLATQDGAREAIETIKTAVNTVSTQRGNLGALQNRLDHTINNLAATTENITASESQIRDCNMAKEMTEFTKNNILAQAAQSMLAQANSAPQGVLQLLQ